MPPTDALIAAAAAEYGGLAVLHRDVHVDRLAEVLLLQSAELPVPWILPQQMRDVARSGTQAA